MSMGHSPRSDIIAARVMFLMISVTQYHDYRVITEEDTLEFVPSSIHDRINVFISARACVQNVSRKLAWLYITV